MYSRKFRYNAIPGTDEWIPEFVSPEFSPVLWGKISGRLNFVGNRKEKEYEIS